MTAERRSWNELFQGARDFKAWLAGKLMFDATWEEGIWAGKVEKPQLAPERLARQWGRLNLQSVVRYVPHGTTFVHCHECRWPVNPGRTHMLLGNEQRTEATGEQMQRICDGVRKHMEAA